MIRTSLENHRKIITLVMVLIVSSISVSFAEEYISPKKQLDSGVPIDQIQCRDDRVLVLRSVDSIACVTEKTAERMNWEIIKNVSLLEFSDIFIKSKVNEINVNIGLPENEEPLRSPPPIIYGYNYVIIAPFNDDNIVLSSEDNPETTIQAKLLDTYMLKLNSDLHIELVDPQAYADKLGLQTFQYLKFFPDYVPDGMELKFIAAWDGGFDLIYAPINVELDPMKVAHRQIFEHGGIIFHYAVSDKDPLSLEEGRKSFDDFTVSGNSIGVQRSVEIVGPHDAIVQMQDDKFGGLLLLHGKISIHAISASFDAGELYKMLEKPIGEDWI